MTPWAGKLLKAGLDGPQGLYYQFRQILLELAVAAACVFIPDLIQGFAGAEGIDNHQVGDGRFVFLHHSRFLDLSR